MNILFKNTSLYSLGTIVPQAAGFILLPVYTRYLSTADYGIINSMAVFGSLISIFFTLCLERSIFRLYYDFTSEKEKKEFLGTILISISVIALIGLILSFILYKYIGLIYRSINFFPYYAITIITSFIGIFSIVPKQQLMLRGKAGFFTSLSLFQFALNALLIIWYIIFKHEGAIGYIKGSLISQIILVPVFIVLSLKYTTLKFNFDFFKNAFFYSLPLTPTIMIGWVLNLSDRIFIERYFTLSDVGLYSLGYKIAGLVVLFSSSFSLAYSPMYFELANARDQKNAKERLYKYNHLYLLMVILFCFIISFFSKEVIGLFFDSKYYSAWVFVPLFSLSFLFSQAELVNSSSIQQSKKLKISMYISIIIVLMNVTLNFILIPLLGPVGATFTSIISLSTSFFITYFYTKKHCYFIEVDWLQLITFILFLLLVFILFNFIFNFSLIVSLISKMFFIGILLGLFVYKFYPQMRAVLSN